MDKKELYRIFDVLFNSYRVCKYLTFGPDNCPGEYIDFCLRVERMVDQLPNQEKEIIEDRFMQDDYVLDKDVYEKLQISNKTYDKRKFIALKKISSLIN